MKTFEDHGITIPHGATGDIHVQCPTCTPTRRKQNTRDLSVNVEKGVWLCHHCSWTGTLGSDTPRTIRKAFSAPRAVDTAPPANKALSWLQTRGITQAVIERNRIETASVYVPQLSKEATAICFPYYRGETLVNRKWRAAPKHFFMEPGAERILYKLGDVSKATIICEGELDALSCEVAGFPNAVSVPDGAPSTDAASYHTKFAFLESDWPALAAVQIWILALDNDGPGKVLERYLAQRLGYEKCYLVKWPEGCKDANDVLVQHGPERLAECINTASAYPVKGIFTVEDLALESEQVFGEGLKPGLSTGWDSLDRLLTIAPGQLYVVTGSPMSGKSTWLDCLTINLAKRHKWPGVYCSPENAPYSAYQVRLAGKWADRPTQEGYHGAMDLEALWNTLGEMAPFISYIYLDEEMTLDAVLERGRILVARSGIRWMVIDPWNEIEHHRPKELTETQYVGKCLSQIKRFCRLTGVAVFLVAHPAKMQKQGGAYPVATPYSISDSAHWFNKPEVCISIHRNMAPADNGEPDHIVEVHVQKMKFRQFGKLGMVTLKWNPGSETFRDMGLLTQVA